MVRVLPHHRADAETVGEFGRIGPQGQRHTRAARHVGGSLHVEFVLARRGPARTGIGAGAPRQHLHFLGDNERTVETNAELADQCAVGPLVAGQAIEEFLGAGFRDGTEIGDHLVAAHADAVVDDRQRAGILVEFDDDAEFWIVGDQRFVRQSLETQSVDGVGGVRNQLSKEYLPVGIQGVDHELQEFLGFGLKAARFLGLRGLGSGLGGHWRSMSIKDVANIGARRSFSRLDNAGRRLDRIRTAVPKSGRMPGRSHHLEAAHGLEALFDGARALTQEQRHIVETEEA